MEEHKIETKKTAKKFTASAFILLSPKYSTNEDRTLVTASLE
jgi:hypothetical protein